MFRHTVYLRRLLLGRYLIVTNTVSAGTLDGLADAVEQCWVERVQPHNWPRTLRMGTTGLLLGPVDHCWYRFLDSRFPGSHAAAVAKKVALDSFMYLPIGIVLFYTRELQPPFRPALVVRGFPVSLHSHVQTGGQELARGRG